VVTRWDTDEQEIFLEEFVAQLRAFSISFRARCFNSSNQLKLLLNLLVYLLNIYRPELLEFSISILYRRSRFVAADAVLYKNPMCSDLSETRGAAC
jgi:hypothetical protein